MQSSVHSRAVFLLACPLQTVTHMKHNTPHVQTTPRTRAFAWLSLAGLALCSGGCSSAPPVEPPFSKDPPAAYVPVAACMAALNAHSLDNAADFASEDWNFINPKGVWSKGRDASVATLNQLEAGVLKDVTFSIERVSIDYASSDVALVTMTTLAANYVPDEALERGTYVVVKQNGTWLIFESQITTVTGGDNVPADESRAYEGPVPSDVGGTSDSVAARTEKAHASVAWFRDLPVTHDFGSAADFTTVDWNLVPPSGFWSENRKDTVTATETAFTTFLDATVFTEGDMDVHFPTDDVEVLIEPRSFTSADVLSTEIATFVVVNHQDHWLLANTHVTSVP
jgi:ketosteroid isomerase-like protein